MLGIEDLGEIAVTLKLASPALFQTDRADG